MPERPATKAARLLVLHELRQAGQLDRLSGQYIADIFGVNRSTIMRDLRTLDQAGKLVAELRAHWWTEHVKIKSPQ